MSADREAILSRVRGALAPLRTRAIYPVYARDVAVMPAAQQGTDLLTLFTERLRGVNGRIVSSPAELVAFLGQGGWRRGYCDPALWPALAPHFGADFTVETSFDRTRVDDFAFGITRAVGAIAETGTLILSDTTTSSRLAALTPWVHVAVLRRADIHPTIAAATAALPVDPNVIWCTGPSKTADVEGILIEGVHGPGQQLALLVD